MEELSELIGALAVLEVTTFSGLCNLVLLLWILWVSVDVDRKSLSWSTVVKVPVLMLLALVPLVVCLATIGRIGLP